MLSDIKHYLKLILGKSDLYWYLNLFQQSIIPETFNKSKDVINWANECLKDKDVFEDIKKYELSSDPIVIQGWKLKKEVEAKFKGLYKNLSSVRILIHVPDQKKSPAGYSLFQNMMESFNFLGIESEVLLFDEPLTAKLKGFKPTVFMTSDHDVFLSKINWNEFSEYRRTNPILLGLTASLAEYGNTPLSGRLDWAKQHEVSFYYNFRDADYLSSRKEYKPFFEAGYKIFSIPFGANPIFHYPVPNIKKDLDYSFIASVNKTKVHRYLAYFKPIFSKYIGFIDGPGWKNSADFVFNRDRDRYIYSRSKIGVNIHLEEQIEWACEVNERTYQLAACGVPQVIDDAKIIPKLFGANTLFVAKTPKEYKDHFEFILKNPEKATENALRAQKEVFDRHTTFHRASDFVTMLTNNFKL